jgi:GNAT superfamily N-acetyltransferase
MPATQDLRITHHDGPQTLDLKDAVLSTYLAAAFDQQHDPWAGPEQFWERLTDLYAPSKDFGMAAGWIDGEMIGFAFGSVRDNDASTWADVAKMLPDLPVPDGSASIYIFREFAVQPARQGKGYGHRLHDALLHSRPEPLAHLLVRTNNEAARRGYLKWGWRKISQLRPFPDAPLMEAMVLPLPLA